MTAKELVAELKKLPGETRVLLASDAEGNDIRPLHEAGAYEDTPGGTPQVVLWPQ